MNFLISCRRALSPVSGRPLSSLPKPSHPPPNRYRKLTIATAKMTDKTFTLNNGVSIPAVGLGTPPLHPSPTTTHRAHNLNPQGHGNPRRARSSRPSRTPSAPATASSTAPTATATRTRSARASRRRWRRATSSARTCSSCPRCGRRTTRASRRGWTRA